jgi:hypothetical protein
MADDAGEDRQDGDSEDDVDEVDGSEKVRPPESVAKRWTNVVGYACIGLTLMGVLLFSASVPRVIDPEQWQCTVSRAAIDDANDDDEPWNDVDLDGAESADDLECEQAVALASSIPTEEDGDDTLAVPSPSATRNFGLVAGLLGLLQVVSGVGTAMTWSRVFRRMAITSALVALIAPVLGFLTLPLIAFVVWALTFSGTAKGIWGEVRFLGGSRRSPTE